MLKRIFVLFVVIVFLTDNHIHYISGSYQYSAGINTLRPISSHAANEDLGLRQEQIPSAYNRTDKQSELFTSILKRLDKEMPRDEMSRQALGKEIGSLSAVFRSISESLQRGFYNHAALLTIEAIKNNIPGITPGQINKWIAECFCADSAFHSGYIAIEAFKKNYRVDTDYVQKSIEGCLQSNLFSVAGQMTLEALKAKIPGISPDNIRRSIEVCLKQNQVAFARKFIIDSMREPAAAIKSDEIINWIEMSFEYGSPFDAGMIALEAQKNNMPGDFWPYIKKGIQGCIDEDFSASQLIIYILTNKMGNVTAKEIDSVVAGCRKKQMSYDAGMVAIEAFNNIPGVTADIIRDIIEYDFSLGKYYSAGLLAVEAIKRGVPGVEDDYVSKCVSGCFRGREYFDGGIIAMEAVKNGISSVSIDDIKTSISEMFSMGLLYNAGRLLSLLVDSGITGITARELKDAIDICFMEKNSYAILPVIQSIINKSFSGIGYDDILSYINKCYIFDDLNDAGYIALDMLKDSACYKRINKIASILNDIPQARDEKTLYFIYSGLSCALKNNKTDHLDIILSAVDEREHFVRALTRLMDALTPDMVWSNIIAQKGFSKIRQTYDNLYSCIFSDTLPEGVDISQKETSILLKAITRFDISDFAGRGKKGFEEIYYDFKKNRDDGKIKPLARNIPAPITIEVLTNSSQSFSPPARKYYKDMIDAAHTAISAASNMNNAGGPYSGIISLLIELADDEISKLSDKARGELINQQALSNIRQRLDLFNKAKQHLIHCQHNPVLPLIFLEAPELNVLSDIKPARPLFRQALFMAAFYNNAKWEKYFSLPNVSVLTLDNIIRFVEFTDIFLKQDLLSNADIEVGKALLKHLNPATFKDEINRFNRNSPCFKKRIGVYPCRGWIAEYIGYYSDMCWVDTPDIIKNNPDVIPLIFVDEDLGEIIGGTLLMFNSIDGEKVMIDRGLSPRVEFTRNISVGDFVEKVLDYEEKIAVSMGAGKIIVPLRMYEEGLGTNNPDIIQYYEKSIKNKQPVDLDEKNIFNSHDITNGRCAVIRNIDNVRNASPKVSFARIKSIFKVIKAIGNAA
ncbi:hypothetical protein EOM82_02500 [bacterium]|nr:hypothetical protein [bacterium]